MSRHRLGLLGHITLCLALSGALARSTAAMDLDGVTKKAAALARETYKDHRGTVPQWMLVGSMSYDQWRDIRFKPAESLWAKDMLPFQVQFFHPGLYYDRTIAVHVIDAGKSEQLTFASSMFDYGQNDFAERVPSDIGYAGLRIHHPLKSQQYFDELIVFLGATYFRALGRDNVYGLSARGIAIDTVEPTGEEFPHFTDFWLEKPKPEASQLVMLALMEGPSITGAYRFVITPGAETVVDVEARLFARKEIRKLGLAPLTSMFFFGEGTRRKFDDFRPEVHDSDGLLLHSGDGEWIWRPLDNPSRVNASGYQMRDPQGFGLIQRDRAFASHQDIETRSEMRPSAWVTPKGKWGKGRVELVEIPTDSELVDNIVAYWVPDRAAQPGKRLDIAYSVKFYGEDAQRPPAGRAVATRQDGGTKDTGHRFVIDFGGGGLEELSDDEAPEAVLSANPPGVVQILDHHVVRNPDTRGWRLAFQLKPTGEGPIDLRAFLRRGSAALTETWTYTIVR